MNHSSRPPYSADLESHPEVPAYRCTKQASPESNPNTTVPRNYVNNNDLIPRIPGNMPFVVQHLPALPLPRYEQIVSAVKEIARNANDTLELLSAQRGGWKDGIRDVPTMNTMTGIVERRIATDPSYYTTAAPLVFV